MTPKLSQPVPKVVLMNDSQCPWCEAELMLRVVDDEQTCPECLTRWSYEDETDVELALAA